MSPVIKRRLRYRWPIFDILPSFGFPPGVCCRSTRPSQAEDSRPRRKLSIGRANTSSASAVMGPIPGIVISRAVSSCSLALIRIFRSSLLIFSSIRSSSSHGQLDDRLRQATVPLLENRSQLHNPGPALRSDHPEFRQLTPKHVDRLCALAHQQAARAKEHPLRLLRLSLDCHEVDGRSLRRFRDRLTGSGRGSDDDAIDGVASSTSSGSGHEIPATSTRRRYVLAVLSEMPTAAAISRRLRPSL